MKESLFIDVVGKYLPRINNIVELYNGKRRQLTYLHKDLFRLEYSVDQSYKTGTVDSGMVTADIVSIDSALPIKKRGVIRSYGGSLPVIGMALSMGTKTLNDLNIMLAGAQGQTAEIVRKVMDDPIRCVNGVNELMEALALEGISNGYIGVQSDDLSRAGEMVRIDYGYPTENRLGVAVKWEKPTATPLTDISNTLDKAKGTQVIMLDKSAYDILRRSAEARHLVASFRGIAVVGGAEVPVPTVDAFNEAFKAEYGVELLVVNRTILTERDGKRKEYNPWNVNSVVFLPERHNVGAIVYGTLPEERADIPGVIKQKPMPYALLRKYSTISPLSEVTEIKGVVAPIVENVDRIYVLDITNGKDK